jgi:hypothetical protein
MFMITKAVESALSLNLTSKHKAKETTSPHWTGIKVILVVIFSATVAVRVDSEGLLPITTVCLV